MSWSFDFIAKDKDSAKAHLVKQHAPQNVKDFITAAIDGIKTVGHVHVKSNGHLADGNSYEVSTHSTTVTPLTVI